MPSETDLMYSSVLPLITSEILPSPTHEEPLGTPFPGSCYTDEEENANWVSYSLQIKSRYHIDKAENTHPILRLGVLSKHGHLESLR